MTLFKKLVHLIQAKPADEQATLTIEEAVAGLMLEAASLDQDFSTDEQTTLLHCLSESFDMDPKECQEILTLVKERNRTKSGVHTLVTLLNRQLNADQRFEVMVQIWQVVLADGRVADIEKQFMRRLAPLLHISDRDSGLARQTAAQDTVS